MISLVTPGTLASAAVFWVVSPSMKAASESRGNPRGSTAFAILTARLSSNWERKIELSVYY